MARIRTSHGDLLLAQVCETAIRKTRIVTGSHCEYHSDRAYATPTETVPVRKLLGSLDCSSKERARWTSFAILIYSEYLRIQHGEDFIYGESIRFNVNPNEFSDDGLADRSRDTK